MDIIEKIEKVLNEAKFKKGMYIKHKKTGEIGQIEGLSSGDEIADIIWNDENSKLHPSQDVNDIVIMKK